MDKFKRFVKAVGNVSIWGYGLFWSWNLIFLAFIFLGFMPAMLPQLIQSIQEGLTPIIFLMYLIILTLIPVAAVIIAITLLRSAPAKLLALGYGVEGPLMILLLIRFFVIRDSTMIMDLISAAAAIGMLALLWRILDERSDERHTALGYAQVGGLTLLLMLGVYLGVFLAFYAIPIVAQSPALLGDVVRGVWDVITHPNWYTLTTIPFFILGSLFGLYTATLLIALPVVALALYIRSWLAGLRALAARQNWLKAGTLAALVLIASVVGVIFSIQQPQHKAYELLKTPPQSVQQAVALQKDEPTLRAGLLNAYLAPLRYISAVGEVGHVKELYRWGLNLTEQAAASVEAAYEWVARPMLYEPMAPGKQPQDSTRSWRDGAMRQEPAEAAKLYEAYFDQTILVGERDALVNAARSTWSGDQALAAWQAVDEHEIHLARQELNITEHGDWAEIELYEVYNNITSQRQEVVYYFSLPESAVLTGLWLGLTPDRDKRFEYLVAPRGAAQQVYREQVRYNIDPALLEQIGPRQYRLRVFPVQPKTWAFDETTRTSSQRDGPPMYMWLTFQVLTRDGKWPLPYLAEFRNVFWDQSTVRLLNNQPMKNANGNWLPPSIPAANPAPLAAHQVTFLSGETVVLRPAHVAASPQLPGNLRLAVVLDRSRSMYVSSGAVQMALNDLRATGADVDMYLTASVYRGEGPSVVKLADLKSDTLVYLGGQDAAELLAQFETLSAGQNYDAILVITDGTGFKLGGEAVKLNVPGAPVWMLHLGGKFPLGYDDATLQAIQASGGGVAETLADALTRLNLFLEGSFAPGDATTDLVDGFEWITYPKGVAAPKEAGVSLHPADDRFAAFAARRLILDTMYRQRANITELATLDHLHALAKTYSLVTPYSSMLVLVNDTQEKRLAELEGNVDRFQREGEAVGETLNPLQVTGVPEPHEWLLIGLGVALLLWLAAKNGKLAWVKLPTLK